MARKKEKITYVDDGRTLADMSGVTGGFSRKPLGSYRAGFKEQWKTYWSAVKLMFVPMLVVICGLIIIYMILAFIFMFL